MSRRIFSLFAAAMTGFCLMLQPASAENRIALVIGNAAYQSVGQLENPVNDATAMTRLLSKAGFEVISALNLTQDDMRSVIRDFSARMSKAGEDSVALVFYAGHGLQVEGENFLVPVDARIERESDVSIETLRLADVMKALDSAPVRTRIVILDACRNNPFSAIQKASGRGLAIVDAPTGSIVAYATAPGAEALDGTGSNSPYSAALIEAMKEPGVQIEQLFKRVRLAVHKSTDGRQTPWESSSLTSNFAFFNNLTNTAIAAATATPAASKDTAAEKPVVVASADPQATPVVRTSRLDQVRVLPAEQAYDVVIEEDSVEYYEEFVKLYPTHPLGDRIRRLLFRRTQMVAWRTATLTNTADAYASYLSRYPNSDHSASAIRLQVQPRLRPIDPIFSRQPKFPNNGNGNGLGNNRPGGFPVGQNNNGLGNNRPGFPVGQNNNGLSNNRPGFPVGQNNGVGQGNNRPGGLPLPNQGNGLGQANNGNLGNGGKVQVPGQNNGSTTANNGRPGGIIRVPGQSTGTATLPNPNNASTQAGSVRPGTVQTPTGQVTTTRPGTIQTPTGQVTTTRPGTVQTPTGQVTTTRPGTIQTPTGQITTNRPSTFPVTGQNNAASQTGSARPGTIPAGRLSSGGFNPNVATGNAGPAGRVIGPSNVQPRVSAPVTQQRFNAPAFQQRQSVPSGQPSFRAAPSRQFSGGFNRRI